MYFFLFKFELSLRDMIIDPLNADMKNSAVPAKFWGTTIVSIRNGRLASGPDVVIINSC